MLFQQASLLGSAFSSPIAYRSKNSINGAAATTTVPKPSGIAVGDLVLVVVPVDTNVVTLSTSSGSAWTAITFINVRYNYEYGLFWKVLTATDVSNTWTLSSSWSYIFSIAYDGRLADTVTLKTTQQNAEHQSTVTLAGFAPAVNHKGAIAIMIDVDSAATDTAPTGWASREGAAYSSLDRLNVADNLGGYSGADVVWTGTLGASQFAEVAVLLEVTGQ